MPREKIYGRVSVLHYTNRIVRYLLLISRHETYFVNTLIQDMIFHININKLPNETKSEKNRKLKPFILSIDKRHDRWSDKTIKKHFKKKRKFKLTISPDVSLFLSSLAFVELDIGLKVELACNCLTQLGFACVSVSLFSSSLPRFYLIYREFCSLSANRTLKTILSVRGKKEKKIIKSQGKS